MCRGRPRSQPLRHCTHSHFASARQHDMHASFRTPCRTPAGICRASHSKPRKEKTFALQLESCCQHASLNQVCMHPTLQVRTDLLLGPHGLLEAALRAYTSRHSRDAFAFHATAFLPRPCCAGSIFATDTVSPRSRPCHGAFVITGGRHGQ